MFPFSLEVQKQILILETICFLVAWVNQTIYSTTTSRYCCKLFIIVELMML